MPELSPEERASLEREHVVDITTTGRKSGEPRRIEVWQNQIDGRTYLAGTPGPRSWYANLLADPRFTLHLKTSVQADLAATARPITDPDTRRPLLAEVIRRLNRGGDDVEQWVRESPLLEVEFA
jgi:deazaflavin-dependent oxidoreductase (nitroreductase family)